MFVCVFIIWHKQNVLDAFTIEENPNTSAHNQQGDGGRDCNFSLCSVSHWTNIILYTGCVCLLSLLETFVDTSLQMAYVCFIWAACPWVISKDFSINKLHVLLSLHLQRPYSVFILYQTHLIYIYDCICLLIGKVVLNNMRPLLAFCKRNNVILTLIFSFF